MMRCIEEKETLMKAIRAFVVRCIGEEGNVDGTGVLRRAWRCWRGARIVYIPRCSMISKKNGDHRGRVIERVTGHLVVNVMNPR